MNNRHVVPALDKAVGVMEYLGRSENGASQAELAKALSISTSTCYRILQTLLARNWVRQLPGNLYDISHGMLTASMKLMDYASRFECLQPLLEQLAVKTGLSCKLSIRQADVQITILRAESPAPMSVAGKVGARFPIVEGSTGAALLYNETRDNIEQLLGKCPEGIDEKEHPEVITERLENLKKVGYCMNIRPNRWKVEAIAAPLVDENDQVMAAITVLGFADEFSKERVKAVVGDLQATIDKCIKIL